MCSNEQEFHDGDGATPAPPWRLKNQSATHVGSVTCKRHHDGEDVLEEDEVEACAMESPPTRR